MAAKKSESTGRKAASAASKVLKNPKASPAAKTAAASALTQSRSAEATSAKAASAAAKTLANPKASKAEKTAAASALTQRPDKAKR